MGHTNKKAQHMMNRAGLGVLCIAMDLPEMILFAVCELIRPFHTAVLCHGLILGCPLEDEARTPGASFADAQSSPGHPTLIPGCDKALGLSVNMRHLVAAATVLEPFRFSMTAMQCRVMSSM
jgi:hypothetical protein